MPELTNRQTEQLDGVDNACHGLLCTLAGKAVEWDIEHIGEIADVLQDIICNKLGIMTEMEFRPYIEKVNMEAPLETTLAPAKNPEDIDIEDQQYPTCPWCGFVHNETYTEYDEGLGGCENCGKDFTVKYVQHYTTEKYVE